MSRYRHRQRMGLCGRCGKPKDDLKKANCYSCRTRSSKQRVRVIEAYGGMCTCCHSAEKAFLSLDHINGDGNAHRRQVHDVYLDLEQRGFPDIVQVLCLNCHTAKDVKGGCPHQEEDMYLTELSGLWGKRNTWKQQQSSSCTWVP